MIQKLFRVMMVCLAILSMSGLAAAQVPATFVMKSGERLNANLLDLDASGWLVSVNGQERRIGRDDVTVIDFTGGPSFPASETAKLAQGGNLLVMRDGQVLTGRMNDVGMTGKRINFMVSGEARDFTSDQVARIYLSAPSSAVATSGTPGTPAQPGDVRVAANRAWTNTGVTVQKGQVLTFSASGQVQLSTDAANVSGVDGIAGQLAGGRASLPGVNTGALIGRIGNGTPWGLGNQKTITAPATGPLYLGVNDDLFTDNSGEYVVSVSGGTVGGPVRRRR